MRAAMAAASRRWLSEPVSPWLASGSSGMPTRGPLRVAEALRTASECLSSGRRRRRRAQGRRRAPGRQGRSSITAGRWRSRGSWRSRVSKARDRGRSPLPTSGVDLRVGKAPGPRSRAGHRPGTGERLVGAVAGGGVDAVDESAQGDIAVQGRRDIVVLVDRPHLVYQLDVDQAGLRRREAQEEDEPLPRLDHVQVTAVREGVIPDSAPVDPDGTDQLRSAASSDRRGDTSGASLRARAKARQRVVVW